jgi:RimJ/RimL family protein N-acetyltransferase
MFPELVRDDVFRIETKRLWLRWPRMADAATIARLAGEKQVAEMTARIPHPYDAREGERYVLQSRQANASGAGMRFVIALLARPDQPIGSIGVEFREGAEPEFGYWLGRPSWGLGYATEAAQAMVDIIFGVTACRGIRASVHPVNSASRRVLEKCGFAFSGSGMIDAPARGGSMPVDFCRLDRSTWASLKGWREPRFARVEPAMGLEARCA